MRAPRPILLPLAPRRADDVLGCLADPPRSPRFAPRRVYLLKNIEDLGVATATAELGLLSKAEELGAFSTLEKLGAFSLIEKTLPLVEKLGLLSLFEDSLETEAGLLFSLSGFILAAGPVLFTLQICGFVPSPSGPLIGVEVAADAALLALGAVGFAGAFAISKLQLAADEIE